MRIRSAALRCLGVIGFVMACSTQPTTPPSVLQKPEPPLREATVVVTNSPDSMIAIPARINQLTDRIGNVSSVEVIDVRGLNNSQILIDVDDERARELGLSAETIRTQIEDAIREGATSLSELDITAAEGQRVPLAALAQVNFQAAPDCQQEGRKVILITLAIAAPGMTMDALRDRLSLPGEAQLTTDEPSSFDCGFDTLVVQ
ncbi:MAG: hypothetical protein AAFP04_10140 [Myxococcota bacterium]